MRKSTTGRTFVVHGHTSGRISPTYQSWAAMIQRCTNPAVEAWKHYGALGVTVYPPWTTFANFLTDMGERPEGTTLDRQCSNGNYEPGNCKWSTASEQQKNKRNTHVFVKDGAAMTLVEWAEHFGISKELAHWRYKKWGGFVKGQLWEKVPLNQK